MASHKQAPQPEHDKDFSDFQSPHEASVDRLVRAIDRAYHRPWLMAWRAFWQGFMGAVGAVVGTAFIGLAAAYIFQLLGGFSLLTPYVDRIQSAVSTPASEK